MGHYDRGLGGAPTPSQRGRLTGGIATSDDRRTWQLAISVCGVSVLLRCLVAAFTPLFPDETYYWEWSRHLTAGYFDHPPAIAWLIAAGCAVFGDTPLGVRFGSVIAGGVAAVLLCASARRIAGDRGALIAALIFAAMPLSAVGLVLASPDAPLFVGAAASWYAVVRAFQAPPRSRAALAWWCAAGVALGVAMSSKYTAVLFPLGILFAVIGVPELRERLREPGPYAAVALAIAMLIPVILWNTRHAWISLTFQLRHGFTTGTGSVIGRELELIGGQAGLVSPVLFVLCGMAVWRALRVRPSSSLDRLFATAALVVFVFFMYSATKRRVEANWPALAYLPAILLLASPAMRTPRVERSMSIGIALAAVLTVVTYIDAFVPILPMPARRDPAARSYGWDEVARSVPRGDPDTVLAHIAADRYQDASELAFHLSGHPRTFSLNMSGRANQYDLWPSFAETARPGNALFLLLDDVPGVPEQIRTLAPHFMTVTRAGGVALARRDDVIKYFRWWRLYGWRGTWPQAQLRSRT